MKTQKISQQQNSQYFQGKVVLENKLGSAAKEQVTRALPSLNNLFEKKSYDLFIKEDEAKKCLFFTVKNKKSPNSSTVAIVNDKIRNATDFYFDMANYVRKEYESTIVQPKFSEKVKIFINNLGKKIFKILTNE